MVFFGSFFPSILRVQLIGLSGCVVDKVSPYLKIRTYSLTVYRQKKPPPQKQEVASCSLDTGMGWDLAAQVYTLNLPQFTLKIQLSILNWANCRIAR